DFFGFGTKGVRYVYNTQTQNASRVEQAGFDIIANYPFRLANDPFDLSVNLAAIQKIEMTLAAGSTPENLVNTFNNPPRLRVRSSLSWVHQALRVAGSLNYTNAYSDSLSITPRRIGAYPTFDLATAYDAGGVTASLNLINLFDKQAPYAVNSVTAVPGIH